MKEKLTISEMAKLRGVTTETLRHYDRIGLFKPFYVDENTGYRYYSIFQYEVLGTIKELRQIGMSIDEIKYYFNERNMKKSVDILRDKHAELVLKLEEIMELEENIRHKIKNLDEIASEDIVSTVKVQEIKKRKLITLNRSISSNLELCYGVIELENLLVEKAPILASNRLGVLINEHQLKIKECNVSSSIFVVAKEKTKIEKKYLKVIPRGLFACIRYYGELWNREESLKKIYEYGEKNNYEIIGDGLQIAQIDITITDNPNEVMFEIQVPIKKT
ncbi:transcriptional regulator [Priestia megaterium]|uniref:MerR family transcriptional regulator n=1 Tax=Priestia megaterium TaxID=1404 RepID=UPI000BF5027C|nr:MerR family transcriptional regulator [Priestia megaterium]PFU62388.1 transcriptional regulator [Priestia megaterium]